MLNCVVLIGRLTKDPELRYTPSGIAVTTFTLAVDRSFKNNGEKETDFIPIVAWKTQAENAANYLKKGRLVAVEGRIQVRTYNDKNDKKRWSTEVIANNVRYLDKGKDGNRENNSNDDNNNGGFGGFGDSISFGDNDIPFS